jgi:RNA polymerase sigma factor (sigma-70 family)
MSTGERAQGSNSPDRLNPLRRAWRLAGDIMEETFEAPERDDWTHHAAALRALARSLISDEHEAEDAVQETWMRYLRHGQEGVREPGQWLARALRNLSVSGLRGRARRRAREEHAARRESLPSGDEILERMELVKRVADHVAALDEPYRSAIHLHYFEGRSAAQIARATGDKLETVRTRLRRGRALLRERLDADENGDRSAWCQALAPLVGLGVPKLTATAVASSPTTLWLGALGMTARTGLFVALALLVAAGVTWQVAFGPEKLASVSPVSTDGPALVQEPLAPDSLAREEPLARREAAEVPLERQPAAAAIESSVAEPSMVSLSGKLVILDEAGVEHGSESGELAFRCLSLSGEEFLRARVENGAWRCEAPRGAKLELGRLLARDRLALSDQRWVADVDRNDLEVRATWTSDVYLRVVSAETGLDLDQVTIKSRSRWRARVEELLPSESRFTEDVVEGEVSPIALPDSDTRVTYWAHAPGHAWGMIEVDHSAIGERRLELMPSSSLTVTVAGNLPDASGEECDYIRLRRKSDGWHWNFAASRKVLEAGPILFDGLPAGRYLVCYERGDEEGVRRGAQEWFDVPLYSASRITLTPDVSLLDPPKAHVFGTLRLPLNQSQAKRTQMRLDPIDMASGAKPVILLVEQMECADGDAHLYRWDAGGLIPGQYVAYFSRIQHRVLLDIELGNAGPVEIEVPELASLSIEVVDAREGTALKHVDVSWTDGALEGVSTNSSLDAPRDAASERWVISAPVGEISLSVRQDGYMEHSQTLELVPGASDLRVELKRASGVRISLVESGVPVRPGFGFWWGFEVTSTSEGRAVRPGYGRTTEFLTEILFELPGEYEIVFPELEGYQQIAPLRVEVRADQISIHEVEVQRN